MGGFSTVFHAIYKGSHVALKRVLKLSGEAGEQGKRRFLNELDIHTKLRHEAIVPVVPPGFFEDVSDSGDAYSYLVTEYCSNGDLLTYLRGRRAAVRGTDRPALHLDEIVHLMRQLCAGVAYLHARGIIHRDIKLRNLLLTSGLVLKIADFGLATVTRWDDMDRFTVCGTPSTAAPEVRPGGSHDLSADIWSMGCVLFTLLTGSAAVNSDKPAGLCELRELRPDFEEKLTSLPSAAQDLVRRMLQQEPWKRPTASEISSHAFLTTAVDRPLASVATPELSSARHAGPTARRRAPLPTPPPDTDVIRSFLSTFRESQAESKALHSRESETAPLAAPPPAAAPSELPMFSSTASSVAALTQFQPAESAVLPRLPQSVAVLACVDIELKKLAAQRVQAHRQARAKLRALRRAVISGTGASGDVGAVTVLGIYGQDVATLSTGAPSPLRASFGSADFSASFSSIRSSSTRQADSTLSSLSYSLPSSASSTVWRRPAATSHPPAPLCWSGSELGYRFQYCTPKASMCVFNHCILAACHSSGACIQLRADVHAHVLVGCLIGSGADAAFSQFSALCLAVHSAGWPATACDRMGVNVCKEPAWAAPPARLCEWQAEPRALVSLRAEHRQLFRFVSHVMTTLCSITPKVVISSPTGTGALMDNSPMPDFRFTTANELACVHIVHREGIAVIVNGSSGARPVAVTVPLTPSVSAVPAADAETLALLAEAQHALSACMLKVHSNDG